MENKELPTPGISASSNAMSNSTSGSKSNTSANVNPSSLLKDALSPTPSYSSMAILSPPASRYAFDNNLNQSIPPIPTFTVSPNLQPSSILNSGAFQQAMSSQNTGDNSNINSSFYTKNENDIPAFEPQTEFILESFTKDLSTFTNWIKNLKVEEQQTTMEILLNNISPEIIPFVKDQVDNIDKLIKEGQYEDHNKSVSNLTQNNTTPSHSSVIGANNHNSSVLFSPITDNTPMYAPTHVRPVSPILALNSEPVTLDSLLNSDFNNDFSDFNGLNSNSVLRNINDIVRPKSAGPMSSDFGMSSNSNNSSFMTQTQSPLLRVFSPDITNQFQVPQQVNYNQFAMTSNNSDHSLNMNPDFAGQNSIKLNHSLSTIASRSQLDSSKSNLLPSTSSTYHNRPEERGRVKNNNHVGGSHTYLNNLTSKYKSSNSLPPAPRNYLSPPPAPSMSASNSASSQQKSALWNAMTRSQNSSSGQSSEPANIIHSPIPTKGHSNQNSNNPIQQVKSPMPKDIASIKLLENIPMWLKALRLHKYTENLQSLNWKDLIELDDAKLTDLGVSTVGARNKLLKSFVFVKENLHE